MCHVTLNLAQTSLVKSQPSVPYGANLYILYFVAMVCCALPFVCHLLLRLLFLQVSEYVLIIQRLGFVIVVLWFIYI